MERKKDTKFRLLVVFNFFAVFLPLIFWLNYSTSPLVLICLGIYIDFIFTIGILYLSTGSLRKSLHRLRFLPSLTKFTLKELKDPSLCLILIGKLKKNIITREVIRNFYDYMRENKVPTSILLPRWLKNVLIYSSILLPRGKRKRMLFLLKIEMGLLTLLFLLIALFVFFKLEIKVFSIFLSFITTLLLSTDTYYWHDFMNDFVDNFIRENLY